MSTMPAPNHDFTVSGHGAYAIVLLHGDLTPLACRHIENAIACALDLAPNVLIDMHRVTSIHPMAWATLVRAGRRVLPIATFAIYGTALLPRGRIKSLGGLTSLIAAFDNLNEALVGLVLHPDTSDQRRADILLDYLHRTNTQTISRRDLFSRVSRDLYPTTTALQQTLDLLEAGGHIYRLPQQRTGHPGRPRSPHYVVADTTHRARIEQ